MNIAIMGAGYVGLPLAIAFSKFYPVICFDIDKKRIEQLQKGYDSNKQHVKKEIIKKSLIFSYDRLLIEKKDTYIITVPTPIKRSNKPDLSMLKSVSLLVGKLIKKNSIIVYESTTYPGCTEEFCIPLLESTSGLKYQKGFHVAYSPERVNPGDKINTLKSITKIVAANDKNTLLRVNYSSASSKLAMEGSEETSPSLEDIEIFDILMGDDVSKRKNFINTNAINVNNLDI